MTVLAVLFLLVGLACACAFAVCALSLGAWGWTASLTELGMLVAGVMLGWTVFPWWHLYVRPAVRRMSRGKK